MATSLHQDSQGQDAGAVPQVAGQVSDTSGWALQAAGVAAVQPTPNLQHAQCMNSMTQSSVLK